MQDKRLKQLNHYLTTKHAKAAHSAQVRESRPRSKGLKVERRTSCCSN